MGEGRFTRRQVLSALGATGVGAATVGVSNALAGGWETVTSPTGKTIYDVVRTNEGAYAVAGSGQLLHRNGGDWTVVDDDGPTGQSLTLRGAGVTDDGERLWMAGSSGALGEYEVATGTLVDHSMPNSRSPTFEDVAVGGPVGDEYVYATKGSGEVLVGERKKDLFEWTYTDTPSATGMTGVDVHAPKRGRAVDTGGAVHETVDAGKTWTQVGVADAQVPFNTVVSGPDQVFVGGGNGQVWRQDCDCALWTPASAGSKGVKALARRNGRLLGAGEAGRVFERDEGPGWSAYETPTGSVLLGVSPGSVDIAVGKSGTIIER